MCQSVDLDPEIRSHDLRQGSISAQLHRIVETI